MKKHNLRPALRYCLTDLFRGVSVFTAILTLILAALMIVSAVYPNRDGVFGGFSLICGICLFVVGVASIREQLRLCLQFGVSRYTAFTASYLSAGVLSFSFALLGEVLGLLAHGPLPGRRFVQGLYAAVYLTNDAALSLTFAQHLSGFLLHGALLWFLFSLGSLFSLAFWRLKKVGTLLLALSIPLLLNLLPWLCEYAGLSLTPLIIWMRADVFHFVLLMVLLLVLTTLGGAGLLRRADICESRGA